VCVCVLGRLVCGTGRGGAGTPQTPPSLSPRSHGAPDCRRGDPSATGVPLPTQPRAFPGRALGCPRARVIAPPPKGPALTAARGLWHTAAPRRCRTACAPPTPERGGFEVPGPVRGAGACAGSCSGGAAPGPGQHWTAPGRAAATRTDRLLCCRILLTVVVIFRILIVAIVGETVYDDEQTMFVCNTLQPGCNQACYDQAFPISHIRYWVFQIIMVCTPSLCFITYSVHQSAKQRERRYSTVFLTLERDQDSMKREDSKKIKNTIVNGVLQNTENSTKEAEPDCLEVKEIPNPAIRTTKSKMRRQEGISRFYIIQVVFRNALEIGFLVGQYFLYGFNVPSMYECDRYPCIKEVECYVSRPTEKTVFLVFMFAVSGICVVLNLAELNHLGWRKIKMAVRGVQAKRKSIYEIRNKDLPRMSMPNFGRTQSSDSAYV
ncbi:hypothetical protein Nmel_008980, partial [Mimus melanotis]